MIHVSCTGYLLSVLTTVRFIHISSRYASLRSSGNKNSKSPWVASYDVYNTGLIALLVKDWYPIMLIIRSARGVNMEKTARTWGTLVQITDNT